MKPYIIILLASLLTSCNVIYQMPNASDDVYYSTKGTNNEPVLTPKVDVDSIIRAHPPKYDSPMNMEEQVTANPLAASYYPIYKKYWDSVYALQPWLSGYYVTTTPPPFDEREEARKRRQEQRQLRRLNRANSTSWNTGWNIAWNSEFYNNWFYNPWPVVGFNNRWNNSWGWGIGLGWNTPFSYSGNPMWGANWGWNPWFGYHNPIGYWPQQSIYDNSPTGPGTMQPRREQLGSTSPTAVSPGNNLNQLPDQQTAAPVAPQMRYSANPSVPVNNTPRLEHINGKPVYIPGNNSGSRIQGYTSYTPSTEAAQQQSRYMPNITLPTQPQQVITPSNQGQMQWENPVRYQPNGSTFHNNNPVMQIRPSNSLRGGSSGSTAPAMRPRR